MNGIAALIIVGILAAIIIVIAVYAARNPSVFRKGYWLANYVESPWAVYARSSGTFDEAAQLALSRATGRATPTPGDHALAATIITRSILGQEHRPEYEADGTPTPATTAEAQRRRELMDAARAHFIAALEGLRRGHARPAPTTRIANAAGGFQAPGAAFIVDHADEFAHAALENIGQNNMFWFANGGQLEIIIDRDAQLAHFAGETRKQTIEERQAAAKAAAKGPAAKQQAVAEYVRLATANTDDPQNTHDSGVLACLRAVVERLRKDQAGLELPSIDAIRGEIKLNATKLSEGRPQRVADVLEVVKRTEAGERIIKIGTTDEECLRRVWLRASDPRNAGRQNALEQAVFDALLDCWEEGIGGRHIVCVNGRTSRILAALVTLDWDERNWIVKKLEQFKNDIFDKSRALITEVAREEAKSGDAAMRCAALSYLATTVAESAAAGEPSEAATAALATKMRLAIERMVDEYVAQLKNEGLESAIPDYMIDAVKAEARAAVTE